MIDLSISDHLAVVTLNRPEKKNALTHAMCDQLDRILDQIESQDDLWCGIITGAGGNFSSGHDLTESFDAPGKSFLDVYFRMTAMTKPLIAAVEGICYAQGAGIALLCDMIVAHPEATFGWPQVKRGIGSVSGPAILARKMPWAAASVHLLAGYPMPASRAFGLQLVTDLSPDPRRLAGIYADDIIACAPLAVRAMKAAMRQSEACSQREALNRSNDTLRAILTTEDAQEGLRAFQEKRPPVWRGR